MPIARVALPVAAATTFDYWVPEGLDVAPGRIVRVTLGARKVTGVVVAVGHDTTVAPEKLHPITDVLAVPPLPEDVLALAEFIASYYQETLGLALGARACRPPAAAGAARAARSSRRGNSRPRARRRCRNA